MYEAHFFPRPFQQTCRLETTSLCLNTRIRVKKNFKIHIKFIDINVNVCLLCALHVMTSIIIRHEDITVNKRSVTHYVVGFRWFSFFAFGEAEKHLFQINPFRPTGYVLMRLRCLEVSNLLRNWNKVKNFIFVGPKHKICQLEIPIFIYKLMCQS